ncbi:MAG: septum formation family protein [Actinobacteria bacterium]|nr:septum formation family protein [Actinomycetota bacterium]
MNRSTVVTLMVLVLAACGGATRSEGGAITEEGRVSALDVEVGDCFDDPDDFGAITSVEAIPCDQLHDNEVFALPQHPAGPSEPYPGDDALNSYAEEACVEAFADYVGIPYEESVFPLGTISPGADTWEDGDREIICILYDPGLEKLEGSMRGAER